jgi:PBP1b-binding outer membrane lipoprotein LpoB
MKKVLLSLAFVAVLATVSCKKAEAPAEEVAPAVDTTAVVADTTAVAADTTAAPAAEAPAAEAPAAK